MREGERKGEEIMQKEDEKRWEENEKEKEEGEREKGGERIARKEKEGGEEK